MRGGQILTVSQVNSHLKNLMDEDLDLKSIFVQGEISNFTHHLKSGHFYFTLKDSKAALKVVMFRWSASQLRFMPQNGMSVIAFGGVQFFERDGLCQFYCTDMQPDGLGALYAAFEQLKARLEAEGLFDPAHKKPLPPLPRRIGVITAKTGAALQDIIHILSRRYPLAELVLIPSLVQGPDAPASLCQALAAAGRANLDLVILGRGGGSLEDLQAFNDESVARAVYACPIPVISAVGHETDHTICDFVADLRAPTPSAAAELAAPDCGVLLEEVRAIRAALSRSMEERIRRGTASLEGMTARLAACSPARKAADAALRQQQLVHRLQGAMAARLRQEELKLGQAAAALSALSPLGVLARGYSITRQDGRLVRDTAGLQPGQLLTTTLADGEVVSQICGINPGKEKSCPEKI